MGAKILIELDNQEFISPYKLIISVANQPASRLLKLEKPRKSNSLCSNRGERLEAIDTPFAWERIAREQPAHQQQMYRIVIYYLKDFLI